MQDTCIDYARTFNSINMFCEVFVENKLYSILIGASIAGDLQSSNNSRVASHSQGFHCM